MIIVEVSWKSGYVRTVDHKVRGSSPTVALMSFGKTLIYILPLSTQVLNGYPVGCES